jgi:hypothetical protein
VATLELGRRPPIDVLDTEAVRAEPLTVLHADIALREALLVLEDRHVTGRRRPAAAHALGGHSTQTRGSRQDRPQICASHLASLLAMGAIVCQATISTSS